MTRSSSSLRTPSPVRAGVAVLTLVIGCTAGRASEQPSTTPSTARGVEAHVDPGRLFETVETLASDGLGGRYSLHRQDIGRAADYIAKGFEDADIPPVGTDYRHDFSMVIGAELTSEPELSVVRRGKGLDLTSDDFAPLTMGGSGDVEGPVVFVGYGARSTKDSAKPYDDLEGIDLEGKIALVLAETPNRPNPRRMYRALRRVRRKFDAAAAPLRQSGDEDALRELYGAHVRELAGIIRPFVGGRGLPEEVAKEVADKPAHPLEAEIDITPFASAVLNPTDDGKTPQFGFRAGRLRRKIGRLRDAGAKAVIVVEAPHTYIDEDRREADPLPELDDAKESSRFDIPVVRMRWRTADRAFRIAKKKLSVIQKLIDSTYKPRSTDLDETMARISVAIRPIEVPVPNVLATIPGTTKPNEVVVLGAHYDHIGVDEEGHGHCSADGDGDAKDPICNGADDNASGTAVVLETARVLSESNFQPERTLVFALFAAEELGLHGSKALADSPPELPPFEDGKVVAMLNIDMVGRLSERGLFVGGVGSSPAWMPLLDRLGTRGIPTLYDASITSRSDHASFYKHDIPVLFFFTGVHDDYHAPGDESAEINREGLTKIATLIHDLTRELASGVDVPFVEPESAGKGLVGSLPGDNPDNVIKRVP